MVKGCQARRAGTNKQLFLIFSNEWYSIYCFPKMTPATIPIHLLFPYINPGYCNFTYYKYAPEKI